FHKTDIPEKAWQWMCQLPYREWNSYHVEFPDFSRKITLPYCSISSRELARHLLESSAKVACEPRYENATPGEGGSDHNVQRDKQLEIRLGAKAIHYDSNQVSMSDGSVIQADVVIDCRGRFSHVLPHRGGFQKFFGFEFRLDSDWPQTCPTLMDGRVDQTDGFRFIYVLPFDPRRVLVEDTRFSDNSNLDRKDCWDRVYSHFRRHYGGHYEVVREESGCLPMPFSREYMPMAGNPLRGGYAGGWFHAATGYSLPLAAKFADSIARSSPDEVAAIEELANRNRFQAAFARQLNRLLFHLVKPEKRWQIFRRFYDSLDHGAIQRFYSHEFTKLDAARILIARPPGGLTPMRFLRSFEVSPCSQIA
ncbi:MAG: lycopene cyclase family protein, partial [Pirellulales bacterium]